jgi:AraC-like DNA-binding protein
MSDTNFNYSLRLGNTKLEVDIGTAFNGKIALKGAKNEQIFHYHAKHELFLAGDEPITVTDETGTREYRRCFVFVPNFLKHRTVRSTDYRFLFSVEKTGHGACGFSAFAERFFSSDTVLSFNTDKDLRCYFDELENLLKDSSEAGRDAALSALKLIFYNVYLSMADLHTDGRGGRESYLIIIEKIINSHSLDPSKSVTLESVAEKLHLGKKQTARIIYKYFGRSLSELVLEKKLTFAASLLTSTDRSVSEIAKEANFHSDNYFFLTFKKTFGLTPLAYRKRAIGG